MMRGPYSSDLRQRMVDAVKGGLSRRNTAELCRVGVSCVIRLMQRVEATGDVKPARYGGFKISPLASVEKDLRAWVAQAPELTIAELHSRLSDEGVSSSPATIAR